MKQLLMGSILAFCLLLIVDCTIAVVQSRALKSRVGNEDVLPVLNGRIVPGMPRAEVERLLHGFREYTTSPVGDDEYWVSYRYWFGLIPPLGSPEIKLVGAVEVLYSKKGLVKKSNHWFN